MNDWVFYLIFLFSVFIASASQVLLKKSAQREYDSRIKEYLNPLVIGAYVIFALSALLTMTAYKKIPLAQGPVIETTGYIYIALLSLIFLKERITMKKMAGTLLIIMGICVFTLL